MEIMFRMKAECTSDKIVFSVVFYREIDDVFGMILIGEVGFIISFKHDLPVSGPQSLTFGCDFNQNLDNVTFHSACRA